MQFDSGASSIIDINETEIFDNLSSGRMLEVRGIDKLETALDEISDELHHQYSLGYYPENKNWNGKFRKVQISAIEKTFKVYARKGYYANPPAPNCATTQ